MADDDNIFRKFNYLLLGEEPTQMEKAFLKACRGKTAAGDFCRTKMYERRNVTFPRFLDEYNVWGVTPRVRQIAIAEYVMSGFPEQVDIMDPSLGNAPRVYGELRRFGAQRDGKGVRQVHLNQELVERYCGEHDVWALTEPLLVSTGLLYPQCSTLGSLAFKLARHELKPDFSKVYPLMWERNITTF